MLAVVALLTAACSAKKAKTGASPSTAASVTATVTATASQPVPSPSPSTTTATPPRPVVSPARPSAPASTKPATTAPPATPAGLSGPPASAFPLAANFPTALAFAPDGRLFWTERAGNVMVYQNGAPRVFARVSTVTTEPGGGYSERGLLGLYVPTQYDLMILFGTIGFFALLFMLFVRVLPAISIAEVRELILHHGKHAGLSDHHE